MDSNYNEVSAMLNTMAWNWDSPRIKAYILDLSQRKKKRYSAGNLPPKHYGRLLKFLQIYRQIDANFQQTNDSWESGWLVGYIRNNSDKDVNGNPTNRLRLSHWVKILEISNPDYVTF